MSSRSSRRRSRRRGAPAAGTPPAATSTTPAGRRASRSKLPLLVALLLGLLLGRIFSDQLAPGALRIADLAMYALLAGTIALSFRAWARRNVEERRRQQLRRRRAREETSEDPDAEEPS